MNKTKTGKSWAMAYCGVAAALGVALEMLGVIIPVAMFIAPALAGFLIATVCVECGRKMAFTAYGAVSLLGLLFVPDKEVALVFTVLLGYYPLIKPWFDRRGALLGTALKLALCNGAVLLMYGLLALLFPAGDVAASLREAAFGLALATLLIGNAAFLLYDRALVNMLAAYRLVWQPRMHKMLGHK